MRRRLLNATLATALCCTAVVAMVSTPVAAATGGRVDLFDVPVRTVETRRGPGGPGSKVTSIEVGSGALQIWTVQPNGVGRAVLHPCATPAPTDTTSFRLSPSIDIQLARIFTSEPTCLTSTVPVHVIVDQAGTVSPTADPAGDQYVELATPVDLTTGGLARVDRIAANAVHRIERPASLSADASAAMISLEVVYAESPGDATAFGCDQPLPVRADVSYARALTANVAAVPIQPGEDLCISSRSEILLNAALLGELRNNGPSPEAIPPNWMFVAGPVAPPSLRPINPERMLDTRKGLGISGTKRLAANDVLELSFGDIVGPDTSAVSMNVTATGADHNGFVTVWPCDGDRPEVSNLNFIPAGAVPNLVVATLSGRGTVCISADQDVHVIADVNGTYEVDGGLHAVPVEPERILDTRQALGISAQGRIAGGNEITLQVTGVSNVATGAGAATLNITATGSDATGFVTVYPCDQPRPTASNLNFRAGEATPNLVTTALSEQGTVCLFTSEAVHLLADIGAWYGLGHPAGLIVLAPTRILDTRNGLGVDAPGSVTASRTVTLDFAATPNVAQDGVAVVMNITAAATEGKGFVTVWPCDQDEPVVSNLNIDRGRNVANLTTVKLSASGTVCLRTTATTHLIADVAGYLTDVAVPGVALVLTD